MSATDTDADAAADTGKKRPRLHHIRCCKAAVPKGLCRGARSCGGKVVRWSDSPDNCVVCDELWWGGHHVDCPRDSGYWGAE
jgi:hypothetical protein